MSGPARATEVSSCAFSYEVFAPMALENSSRSSNAHMLAQRIGGENERDR